MASNLVEQLAPHNSTKADDQERSTTNTPPEARLWSVNDPVHCPLPTQDADSKDPWKALLEKGVHYDRGQCKAWQDEIDKVLLFAALFSAIVTAFTIESSKRLEVDHQEATAAVLLVVQRQLDSLARQNVTTLPPLTMDPTSTFHPPTYAVIVNMLWYLSLLLSLATVLIGILCLQWLREHRRDPNSGPEDVFAIRALRIQSLNQWHVSAIVGMLPMLLLAALLLFFAGLGVLLWRLNSTVAIAASAAIGTIVFLLVLTTVLPAVFTRCAFRSPQAWALYYVWYSLDMLAERLRIEASRLRNGRNNWIAQPLDSSESKQATTDWFTVDEETIKAKGDNGFDWFTSNFTRDPHAILMFVKGVEAKVSGGHFLCKEDESLFIQMYYLAMGKHITTTLQHGSTLISGLSRGMLMDAALALCMEHAVRAHPSLQSVLIKRRLELQLRILTYFSVSLGSSQPRDERKVLDALMPALLKSISGDGDRGTDILRLQEELGTGFHWQICKVNELYFKEKEGRDLRDNTCHEAVFELNERFESELAATDSVIDVEAALSIAHYLHVWTYQMKRFWGAAGHGGHDTRPWYDEHGHSFASLARAVQRKTRTSLLLQQKLASHTYGINWLRTEQTIGVSVERSNLGN